MPILLTNGGLPVLAGGLPISTVATPAPTAPTNDVAPAINGADGLIGETLFCTSGTWSGTTPITYAYQWKRNGSPISGATSSSYTLVSADLGATVLCTVTATNAAGSATANSNSVIPSDPVGLDVVATFGALTLEQQGGVVVTGTSISSGDPSGHWRIDSGRIHPSAAGVGNLAGTYSLTLNNGETVSITIAANRRDVRTDAELSAAISAINGGIIHLRAGNYTPLSLTSVSKTLETVIQSDPKDTTITTGWGETRTYSNRSGEAKFTGSTTVIGCSNLTFRNLEFHLPGNNFRGNDEFTNGSWVVQYRSNNTVKFSRCHIHGDTPVSYDYAGGYGLPWGIGSGSRTAVSSFIDVSDCLVNFVYVAFGFAVGPNGPHHVERNLGLDIFVMAAEMKLGYTVGQISDRMRFRSNVFRGIWCAYTPDTRPVGEGGFGIHSAAHAVQGLGIAYQWDVAANIFLPVYSGTYLGGIDMDGDSSATGVRNRQCKIRGNILVARQHSGDSSFWYSDGGCEHLFNTNLCTVDAGQSTTGNWEGPRNNFFTPSTTYGANRCYGNLGSWSSGCVAGNGVHIRTSVWTFYGTTTPPATVTAGNCLSIGHGGYHAANGAGVITSWPAGSAPGSVANTSAGARMIDIFNGDNNAGDFTNIDTIDGLYQTDAHKAALGYAVGALQQSDSYVTFAPGHIYDPQDAVIDETMEPA